MLVPSQEAIERAREVLDNKSRSYVQDAYYLAKVVFMIGTNTEWVEKVPSYPLSLEGPVAVRSVMRPHSGDSIEEP